MSAVASISCMLSYCPDLGGRLTKIVVVSAVAGISCIVILSISGREIAPDISNGTKFCLFCGSDSTITSLELVVK